MTLFKTPVAESSFMPGYSGAIGCDAFWTADALIPAVAVKTARAGVHCGDQQKTSRIAHCARGACDGDVARFQWLAQRFQRAAFELWQFVHKKYAEMGE